jgi:hypothetical protein
VAELVYHVAVSLDNFIADQAMLEGDINHSFFLFEGEHVPDFLSDIQHYEAVLMGSKTYEFGFQFGAKPGEPGYKGFRAPFSLIRMRRWNLSKVTPLRLLKTSSGKVTESYGFAGAENWLERY